MTTSQSTSQAHAPYGMPGGDEDKLPDSIPGFTPYDTSTLSFGLSGASPVRVRVIRAVEWVTGKITLLRIAREFDRTGRRFETTFWARLLELLRIDIDTTDEEKALVPATGPLVVVANHPFGFIDGLVLAALVSEARPDIKILTRAFFATLPEIRDNMVPVAFPHDEDAVNRNIAVRREVMQHLAEGGAVILFPAGRCATARTPLGKAREHPWNPFTAKMILRSNARVLRVFFPGQNGRLFQFFSTFSPTLRQSMMMHEIRRRIGTRITLRIAEPMERDEIDPWILKPRAFMDMLRSTTLAMERHSTTGL